MAVPEAFRRGREAFDAGRFFEAHEHWEEVWKAAPAETRPLFQALIQLAAACLKIARREYAPARRLLTRAVQDMQAAGATAPFEVAAVRVQAQDALERLEALGPERLAEFEPGWFPRLGPGTDDRR